MRDWRSREVYEVAKSHTALHEQDRHLLLKGGMRHVAFAHALGPCNSPPTAVHCRPVLPFQVKQ